MEGEVKLESLTKSFGGVVAVDGIDLDMPPGEFFTMVGPSGCGKTTTLRMIAGFERPTSGHILLDGIDVAQTPPHKRNVNTVFQSYALFPHLNVADNVAFGLKYRKATKAERRSRVAEMLDLVQLTGFEKRMPTELSGGQQQRVALARALVLRPRVLLLDEPLGALDARLRKDLQVELKALQVEIGVTFVFVTHDQEEALTMSDRIAVMNVGHVEQAGPPQAVYEEPQTLFVADFLGVSNLIGAQARGKDGNCCRLQIGERSLTAEQGAIDSQGTVKAMIRPERVRVEPPGHPRRQPPPGHGRARGLPRQLPRAPRPPPRRRRGQGRLPQRRDAAHLRRRHAADASLPPGSAPRPGPVHRRRRTQTTYPRRSPRMATESTIVEIDRQRIKELTEREEKKLDDRTHGSRAMYERARKTLSAGVASSYQVRDPWPIYLSRGSGARVWDVDGNELLDFHNGYGSMVQGHAHPAIGEGDRRALSAGHALRRARPRTRSSSPRSSSAAGACPGGATRTRAPSRPWTRSGSRAPRTGRDTIMKIFGSYHGHHDYVMVSIGVPYDAIGDRENYASLPYGGGIPQSVADLTIAVPFNDAGAMERRIERLIEEGRKPACVIMEAAMMNLGVVLPEPGYLEAVRELTRKHGIILIFDEVKTGLCIAPGGATERFGVMPDMVTLAKTLGGGLPSGAIGGTEEVFEVVEDGTVYQVGTYNGNPLTMAAARASLLEVMTPDALRAPRRAERPHPRRLPGRDRALRPARLRRRGRREGMRDLLADEDRRLRDLQGEPGRRARRPRLALQHEPRRVHDPGPGGGVDALRRPFLRGLRRVRRGLRGDGRRSDRMIRDPCPECSRGRPRPSRAPRAAAVAYRSARARSIVVIRRRVAGDIRECSGCGPRI